MAMFNKIKVSHRYAGNTLISWRVVGAVPGTTPAVFTIEWARTGAGPWHECDAAVFDAGLAIDGRERLFGSDTELFYRVKMTTSEGFFYSDPSEVGAYTHDNNVGVVEETYRLLLLNYDHTINPDVSPGCLFKRRLWGPTCKACRSRDTGEILDNSCEVCWGTGIVKGYYPPVSAPLIVDPRTEKYEYIGVREGPRISKKRTAKGIAWPVPFSDRDIWLNMQTGEIYQIALTEDIVSATQLGNVILEQKFPFEIIPADEIVYRMDLSACADTSLLPPGSDCEGWEEEEPECVIPQPEAEQPVLPEIPERVIPDEPDDEESGEQIEWPD